MKKYETPEIQVNTFVAENEIMVKSDTDIPVTDIFGEE